MPEVREPWWRWRGFPRVARATLVLGLAMLLAAATLDWPSWVAVLLAIPMTAAVAYLRFSPLDRPWRGPGMVADFLDEARGRPRRSDSWKGPV